MENLKKLFVLMTLVAMGLQLAVLRIEAAFAATGTVVINEIAWAGTADSSTDEWIELYNNSSATVDLSGFYIEDDGSTVYQITAGEIGPRDYFVIEDNEETLNSVADALIGLSLANSGDSLVLKDASGNILDSVNSASAAWAAGNNTTKASMERIDPNVSGDSATNFSDCAIGNGVKSRNGNAVLGTPGSANSNFAGGILVEMKSEGPFDSGEEITINFEVAPVENLFSYGVELNYDQTKIHFVSAEEGDLLNMDNASTSFLAALENDQEGKLIVGNSRIGNTNGVSGEGVLFSANFEILAPAAQKVAVSFGAGSFLSTPTADIESRFSPYEFTVGEDPADDDIFGPVQNGRSSLSSERFGLKLNWDALPLAEAYRIYKQMPDETYKLLEDTDDLYFVDSDQVLANVTYNYKIVPLKNNSEGIAVNVTAIDTRGVTGDNDKSDRVDGRDLFNLAKSYGSNYGQEKYNILMDSNYDGVIDGNDLIDVGANFGIKY